VSLAICDAFIEVKSTNKRGGKAVGAGKLLRTQQCSNHPKTRQVFSYICRYEIVAFKYFMNFFSSAGTQDIFFRSNIESSKDCNVDKFLIATIAMNTIEVDNIRVILAIWICLAQNFILNAKGNDWDE